MLQLQRSRSSTITNLNKLGTNEGCKKTETRREECLSKIVKSQFKDSNELNFENIGNKNLILVEKLSTNINSDYEGNKIVIYSKS